MKPLFELVDGTVLRIGDVVSIDDGRIIGMVTAIRRARKDGLENMWMTQNEGWVLVVGDSKFRKVPKNGKLVEMKISSEMDRIRIYCEQVKMEKIF